MNNELDHWSVLENDLEFCLYNILAPVDLGFDEEITWDQFQKNYPHLAYAWRVREKFNALQDSFEGLQMFKKMIAVDDFPIPSGEEGITRYEWLRITVDLMFYRLVQCQLLNCG